MVEVVEVIEVEVAVSWVVVAACSRGACGELVESVEVAVVGVEIIVVGVVVEVVVGVEVSVLNGVEVAVIGVEVACPELVEGVVSGVEVDVVGGVVVAIGGVEVAVEITIAGVEVVEGSTIVSPGTIEMSDMRCLLSHSATAVTPSCQESYVRVLPSSVLPTLPGFIVSTAIPTVPNCESSCMMAIMSLASTA